MPRLLLIRGLPIHFYTASFLFIVMMQARIQTSLKGSMQILLLCWKIRYWRNKWINCASLAIKGCPCTSKETLLLFNSLGWSKCNSFAEDAALVFHWEPLQQEVCNNYEITTGMIIFPITPYKSQRCLYAQKENASYTHLHGRLHNQRWNISAPSTGQNKRIVIYTWSQQNQCCESIQVES